MKVEQSYKGPTIYTGNHVTEELVQTVKDALNTRNRVHVSFDVIGRTKHEMLSYELAELLGDEYDIEVKYSSYWCMVRRKVVG